MVIYSLGALDLGVERQCGARFHGLRQLLVGKAHAPDSGAGGATVLLEHALAVGQGGREGAVEGLDVVVGGGIGRDQVRVIELDQGILGAVGHHLVRGGHADQAGVGKLGKQVEVALLTARDVARIHAGNVGIEVLRYVLEELLGPLRAVEHNLCVPTGILDAVDDRHGVLTVSIDLLVGSAFNLEDDDCLVHSASLSLGG